MIQMLISDWFFCLFNVNRKNGKKNIIYTLIKIDNFEKRNDNKKKLSKILKRETKNMSRLKENVNQFND